MRVREPTSQGPPMEDPRVEQLVQEYAQLAEQVAALTEQLKALQRSPDGLPLLPGSTQQKPEKPQHPPDVRQYPQDVKQVVPDVKQHPQESLLDDMSVDSILAELHRQKLQDPSPQQAVSTRQTPYLRVTTPTPQAPPSRQTAPTRQASSRQAGRGEAPSRQAGRAETPSRQGSRVETASRQEGRVETPPRAQNAQQAVPLQAEQVAAAPAPRKSKVGAFIGNVLFYGVMLALVVGVFVLRSGSGGAPVSFAGYTAQIVLTSSMEEVIPKGSLVISKQVDPSTLQIGDDITYQVSQTTTITHRIIGITERYEDTGQRGFQTQGVMNDAPDKELVPAGNVIGKVVFHSIALGQAANFVSNNWPILIFLLVLLIVFIKVMQRILRKDPEGADETPPKQRKRVNRR